MTFHGSNGSGNSPEALRGSDRIDFRYSHVKAGTQINEIAVWNNIRKNLEHLIWLAEKSDQSKLGTTMLN